MFSPAIHTFIHDLLHRAVRRVECPVAVPEQRTVRSRISGKGEQTRAIVSLSAQELATLDRIANYYDRNWGAFRHVVRAISGRNTRARFALVSEEGQWLQRFVQAAIDARDDAADWCELSFTPLALVAFWGRLLSSLASPHARKKLKADEISRREVLVDTLETAAIALFAKQPHLLLEHIATRRLSEQQWMRDRLNPSIHSSTGEIEPTA